MLNNENIMISVIVPIYNARKTLLKCLESILQQNNVLLEVICVDDESKDDSLLLCKKIAETDNRVKVLTKMNGGVASARNFGLKMAKGKYVTFVDQDDWIDINAYNVMLRVAEKSNADMVVCNYTKDYSDEIRPMVNRSVIQSEMHETKDLIRYAFFREEYRGFAAFVWNKIFRREFLKEKKIMFDDTLRRGDDVLFFANIALAEPRTIYVDQYLYHYVQRSDSVTHTLTKQNIDRLGEILIGYERAIEILERHDVSEEALGYMKCFYVYHASVLYELADKENVENQKGKYMRAMKIYLDEYKDQNANNKDRIDRICKLIEIN